MTLFHTSHPSDTRPDPFTLNGGLDSALSEAPLGKRPAVNAATLSAEIEALSKEVSATGSPTIVLDRIMMAASGKCALCLG